MLCQPGLTFEVDGPVVMKMRIDDRVNAFEFRMAKTEYVTPLSQK